MKKIRYLSLRVDPKLHYKLNYAAQYDGRTMSGLIIYLIKQFVTAFENQYGEIELPPGIR